MAAAPAVELASAPGFGLDLAWLGPGLGPGRDGAGHGRPRRRTLADGARTRCRSHPGFGAEGRRPCRNAGGPGADFP